MSTQPTAEIDAFIERIQALPSGPGVSLDAALQPSLDDETELRKLFANDRQNARLSNPHVGLIDVFKAPDAIRATRARVVEGKEDLSQKYVMPLADANRRKEGTPCMVSDLEEFQKNWAIFSEGALSQLLDWNNVVAAGGSVLACLAPLDEEDKKSKRATRKFYHSKAYPTSDVDLFLWGLNAEQAEAKIIQIYEAVRDSVPWDVTCIRTKHTVSIHSQYPYRSVQIILRQYHSPAEILAGFDIDAPCCAYDGSHVWANPRAVVAMMRQCNTVDMTRRSPSYEVRLAKYSQRFYEVYVPTLARDKIDPTIYERSIARMEGLARLLVLEKLQNEIMRTSFLQERRKLRGRPLNPFGHRNRRNRRKYKGDLKEETGLGVEMNDYDVASLHIPYGPGWDARRIDKLVYQTDLGMNSTFNPKNEGRRLHRHPAFFGTVEEVLEDCCEHCPKPIDEDERELQKEEDEQYVRGRISFIEENPGRQTMTGSFNPIDEGEWSDQVYIKPVEQLFKAIAARDRTVVQRLLKDEAAEINVNQRDHVGRTTLHVAILSKAEDIAGDLIDAGARISARLADGRAPLHLAAQYDMEGLIEKLIERSRKNKLELEKKEGKKDGDNDSVMDPEDAPVRPSSEDDWSSHDDEDVVMSAPEEDDGDDEDEDAEGDDDDEEEDDEEEGGRKSKKGESKEEKAEVDPEEIPDDESEEPDIIEVDIPDWDFGFSALCYAVLFGSMATLEALLDADADFKAPTNPSSTNSHVSNPFHPLTLTLVRKDEDEACQMAERLLIAGATSTTANETVLTIFHIFVMSGRSRLVETLLRCDPNINTVLNLPQVQHWNATFPIVSAIQKRHYATLVVMLAHGAKLVLEESDVSKASEFVPQNQRSHLFGHGEVKNYLNCAYQPIEIALRHNDDVVQLLIALGAAVDCGLKRSLSQYVRSTERQSLKDWVDYAVLEVSELIRQKEADVPPAEKPKDVQPEPKTEVRQSDWMTFIRNYQQSLIFPHVPGYTPQVYHAKFGYEQSDATLTRLKDMKDFLLEVQSDLVDHKARTWHELYPDVETAVIVKAVPFTGLPTMLGNPQVPSKVVREETYVYLSREGAKRRYMSDRLYAPEHLLEAYDELYDACYAGDNDKIQKLCLPIPGQPSAPGAPSPLNISVRMVSKDSNQYDLTGYTPLFAAISAKKWSTAKLILAIATAQYRPEDDNEKIKFDVDVNMDSDTESVDSDASDITVEQMQVNFIDVATRPSEVRTNTHPKALLDTVVSCQDTPLPLSGMRSGQAPVIALAIVNHDLDAFVHIANLYDSLPQPLPLPDLFPYIIQQDRPDILEEYIKHTGFGIDLAGAKKESGDAEPIPMATNDENKVYLGLNVHGKKRADLAKKNDPDAADATEEQQEPALLWRAIKHGAKEIVSYLASDRPLTAYQHYASTHSDPKAIWFKRMGASGDLGKWLPIWLGWTISNLGESPLSAAIVAGTVDTVKLLAKLNSKLVTQALQTNIKFLGINPLMLAVRVKADTSVIEYLLSRNISAVEKDAIRGWNIYHFLCDANNGALLKFFLQKLPRDVNESLLAQKSKLRGNTPLLLAVKRGFKDIITVLLDYTKDGILVQDVDGETPLHSAVSSSYSAIVEHLLSVIPSEGLFIENSVGITPWEMVSLNDLVTRMKELLNGADGFHRYHNDNELGPNEFDGRSQRIHPDQFVKYDTELQALQDVVENRIDRGTLKDEEKSKLKERVMKWVGKMEVLISAAKKREAARKEAEKAREENEKKQRESEGSAIAKADVYAHDTCDQTKTFECMQRAYDQASASSTDVRRLIHILDVQKSVRTSLAKVNPKAVDSEYGNRSGMSYSQYQQRKQGFDEDGYYDYNNRRQKTEVLENEDDEDLQISIKKGSMVFELLGTMVERL